MNLFHPPYSQPTTPPFNVLEDSTYIHNNNVNIIDDHIGNNSLSTVLPSLPLPIGGNPSSHHSPKSFDVDPSFNSYSHASITASNHQNPTYNSNDPSHSYSHSNHPSNHYNYSSHHSNPRNLPQEFSSSSSSSPYNLNNSSSHPNSYLMVMSSYLADLQEKINQEMPITLHQSNHQNQLYPFAIQANHPVSSASSSSLSHHRNNNNNNNPNYSNSPYNQHQTQLHPSFQHLSNNKHFNNNSYSHNNHNNNSTMNPTQNSRQSNSSSKSAGKVSSTSAAFYPSPNSTNGYNTSSKHNPFDSHPHINIISQPSIPSSSSSSSSSKQQQKSVPITPQNMNRKGIVANANVSPYYPTEYAYMNNNSQFHPNNANPVFASNSNNMYINHSGNIPSAASHINNSSSYPLSSDPIFPSSHDTIFISPSSSNPSAPINHSNPPSFPSHPPKSSSRSVMTFGGKSGSSGTTGSLSNSYLSSLSSSYLSTIAPNNHIDSSISYSLPLVGPSPEEIFGEKNKFLRRKSSNKNSKNDDNNELLDPNEVVVGIYTRAERTLRILRYRQKKKNRVFNKMILYSCRKKFADQRPRKGGRFVKIHNNENNNTDNSNNGNNYNNNISEPMAKTEDVNNIDGSNNTQLTPPDSSPSSVLPTPISTEDIIQ